MCFYATTSLFGLPDMVQKGQLTPMTPGSTLELLEDLALAVSTTWLDIPIVISCLYKDTPKARGLSLKPEGSVRVYISRKPQVHMV